MIDAMEFDFVIVGAGSAGCAVAGRLAAADRGSVCVLEAGASDRVPQVKVPFGLLYTMGSARDWRFRSTAQVAADGRALTVNRGRMLGGSSSINSMVWFRGRRDDFDGWDQPGWAWADVAPAFAAIDAAIAPARLPDPHPLSQAFGRTLGSNGMAPPTPERESAGVFHTNMRNGRRWSAADAFLRPARATGRVQILTGANVDRILFRDGQARQVQLIDKRIVTARRGIVLCAGSIGSPAIVMRSGLGPAAHLNTLGIPVLLDAPGVGQNLHDHPSAGVHHAAPGSGYGLTWRQLPGWALSPLQWLAQRKGRMTSNFVEAGAFFRARPPAPNGDRRPDVQVHFMPYMMGYKGRTMTTGAGYFADVCVCRPLSRGTLTLLSSDPRDPPQIDLGLLSRDEDLDTLVDGIKRLRVILAEAPFGPHAAPEVYPAAAAQTDSALKQHVRARCGTAYHPVGTLRMGTDPRLSPVTPDLKLRGVAGLWVADASVMPQITSANTNAPSMMIGYRAAEMIMNA